MNLLSNAQAFFSKKEKNNSRASSKPVHEARIALITVSMNVSRNKTSNAPCLNQSSESDSIYDKNPNPMMKKIRASLVSHSFYITKTIF